MHLSVGYSVNVSARVLYYLFRFACVNADTCLELDGHVISIVFHVQNTRWNRHEQTLIVKSEAFFFSLQMFCRDAIAKIFEM